MPYAAPKHDTGHKPPPARRLKTAERGYGSRWRRERERFLRRPENVLCCVAGCNRPANEVDHIVPHRGDYELMWDVRNWRAMCHRHHSEKTARENGGFGRKPKTEGNGC